MKKTIILLLMLPLGLMSCKNDNITIVDTRKNNIDELANRYYKLKRFSGTILVMVEDSIVYNQSFGLADYENSKPFTDKTAFKVGALTELITKDIVIRLAKEGKLELTDSLTKHIPQLKSKVTINDLLNHRTNFLPIKTIKEKHPDLYYDAIAFANMSDDSIKSTNQSQLSYNILGLLIENINNRSFQETIEAYCNDLKLEHTFYIKTDQDTANGYQYHNYRNNGLELQRTASYDLEIAFSSRGLKSTARDLAKIAKAITGSAISIDGYTTNDGFSFSLQKDKEGQKTIVVLSNFRQPIAKEISNSIDSILANKSFNLPLEREPFDIDKNQLSSFNGMYQLNQYVKFEVTSRNDSLFTILGPNEVHLIPQSKNQFYMKDRDASMRFLRNDDSIYDTVELLDGFINGQMAHRID